MRIVIGQDWLGYTKAPMSGSNPTGPHESDCKWSRITMQETALGPSATRARMRGAMKAMNARPSSA